jgi:hypothetical protein
VSDKPQNSDSDQSEAEKGPRSAKAAKDDRAARLSDALRGNLRRRKAQTKARPSSAKGEKGPGLLAAIKSEKQSGADKD